MNKISSNNKQPIIGIFDSGLGGLTILNQLNKDFNNYKFIYFGDTAHLPYGTKSHQSIIKFCEQIVDFLISKGATIIIIACHSASAVAIDFLRKKYSIPIIDVIQPTIKLSLMIKSNKSICVLGTSTTISSNTYSENIKKLSTNIKVYEVACPLFVPIVEEGLENSLIANQIAEMYLNPLKSLSIDSLILGCTHYPMLYKTIKKIIHKNIIIIDTGVAISDELKQILPSSNDSQNDNEYYVSDLPYRFNELASKFLKYEINNVKQISLK
ncbi:MAG: glutamate racemase [Candidatus Marinimicrobia bacterium]|nr:glutamate racemase [Candidatus Neomarinimicrobiota bacterium]|tara:strand:- start:16545 stop:17351 length:807 start_codon:yes stop_codon:yes gene_type:complete